MSLEDRRERENQVADFLMEYAAYNNTNGQVLRNRRATMVAANNQLFLEEYEKVCSKIFKSRIVPKKYSLKPDRKPKARIVNLALSDLHYGAMLDASELPLSYGPVEEARRTSAVVLQAADYKRQYRNESKLYIHILGDIIQGQLHDPRDGAPLAAQMGAALYYLVQAVTFLASVYPEVEVFTTPGNHGRNKARHPERAVVQKWDSMETTIYIGLRNAVAHLPNVTVHVEKTPYYIAQAFDQRGFYTHGDTVLEVGFPDRGIDTAKAKAKINAMIVSGINAQLFMTGHVHTGSLVPLNNGVKLMTNGCLIPTDHYALSKGIISTTCVQWIWESVPGHIVGDVRDVEVNENTDKDASLDVIKPYLGL